MVTVTISPDVFSNSGSAARYLTDELTHNGTVSALRDFTLFCNTDFYLYNHPEPLPQGPADGGRADCTWDKARKYDVHLSPEPIHGQEGDGNQGWFFGKLVEPNSHNFSCPSLLDYTYPETSKPSQGLTSYVDGSYVSTMASLISIQAPQRSLVFRSGYSSVVLSLTDLVERYYSLLGQPVPNNAAVTRLWVAHDEYVDQTIYGADTNPNPPINWRCTTNSIGWGVRPRMGDEERGWHIGFNSFGPEQFVSDSLDIMTHTAVGASDWVELPTEVLEEAYAKESVNPASTNRVGVTFMGFLPEQLSSTPPSYPHFDSGSNSYETYRASRYGATLVFRAQIEPRPVVKLGRLRVLVDPDGPTLNKRWKFANYRGEE